MEYSEHYRLQASLSEAESILPAVQLFDTDIEQLYSLGMELLASTLPSGRESPFSNKATGSAQSILLSALLQMIEVLGYEINLMPDRAWINFFRLLGAEQLTGEFPIIELFFSREARAVSLNIDVTIPIGTEVRNSLDQSKSAYTTETVVISGSDVSASVIARVDILGEDINTRIGSYNDLVQKIPYIDSVKDITYLSAGRDPSTLADSVLNTRQGIRSGNLGRMSSKGLIDLDNETFLGRAVTLRDYIYYSLRFGAAKANAFRGRSFGSAGYFGDLVTVVIYPATIATAVKNNLLIIAEASVRLDTIPAVVIPIDGIIEIKIAQNFSRQAAVDAISVAIVDNINPPFGGWGDQNLGASIATEIEKIQGIYAVPNIFLKNANSGVPLEGLSIEPWNLFEIQDTIEIKVV